MSEEIEETEISFEEPESQEEPKVKQASSEEELDTYSKGVQSRIKKLTEKYRQEERDKGEAVRLSQQQAENSSEGFGYGLPVGVRHTFGVPNRRCKAHLQRGLRSWRYG